MNTSSLESNALNTSSKTRAPRLFIVTGDPSADLHASHVVRHLKARQPDIEVAAVGDQALRDAGATLIEDQSQMGQVGAGAFWSAYYHWQLGKRILTYLDTFQPDIVLLMDYGGFNLRLAKYLKAKGHRIAYFIPPQVWASRRGRIQTIKRYIDHVYCIFPFEVPLYEATGIPVTYVGHPLVGQLPPPADRHTFCERHGLSPDHKIIAIFPGSRKMEIDYLLKPLIEAAQQLQQQFGTETPLQFVIAKAASLKADYFQAKLAQATQGMASPPHVTLVEGENHALQSVADVGIIKSGTSTLETAIYKTPMVIVYKAHWIVGMIARKLAYYPCLGLPNIMTETTDNPIVPELLQDDVTAQNICHTISELLNPNSAIYQHEMTGYEQLAQLIPTQNATETVACELLKLFNKAIV